MIQIKPVSDLRNNFASIEKIVEKGETVYLTKNGYGKMVVMSLDEYARITDRTEICLDEADIQAAVTKKRLLHNEVFDSLRNLVNEKKL